MDSNFFYHLLASQFEGESSVEDNLLEFDSGDQMAMDDGSLAALGQTRVFN